MTNTLPLTPPKTVGPPPNLTLNFRATSLSSIIHGGGNDGTNIIPFRRETIIHNGEPTRVPVISGNGLRGVLRRSSAWLLADLLDLAGKLTPAGLRVLSSGGDLKEEQRLPVAEGRAVHDLPPLHLFGGTWEGTIHAGSFKVGKLYPVARETVDVTGVPSDTKIGRLLQLEQFTRHDTEYVPAEEGAEDPDGTNQMIYQVETLAAGAALVGSFTFTPWTTPADVDWFHATLRAWTATGGYVGGKSATGHGRIRLDTDIIDDEAADRATEWAVSNTGEAVELLRLIR